MEAVAAWVEEHIGGVDPAPFRARRIDRAKLEELCEDEAALKRDFGLSTLQARKLRRLVTS